MSSLPASPACRSRSGVGTVLCCEPSSERAGGTSASTWRWTWLRRSTGVAQAPARRAIRSVGAVAMRSQWDRSHSHSHYVAVLAKGKKNYQDLALGGPVVQGSLA